MIYFYINLVMYSLLIVILYKYFNRVKITILDFLLLFFNINLYLILLFKDFSFIYGLISSILIILIKELSLLLFKDKNNKEIFLIKEGIINFHELVNNNYSYNKLINYLKKKKIKLDEIEYCILKNNELTLIKNNDIKNYPVSIIIDGKVLENNLKLINKDINWLKLELNNNDLKGIEYAYFKKDKLYFITS